MSSIDIDTGFLEKLADLLARSGLSEIEIAQGETRIRVVRHAPAANAAATPAQTPARAVAAEPVEAPPARDAAVHPGTITAPMVGTVYLQPEPGAPPFVQPGDAVEEGQTLLIIEAMKVMNPIRATRAGRVREILVENAQPVEYGEPLLVIE